MTALENNSQNAIELPQTSLMRMIRSYQVVQMIYVATKLNLADLLADGPRNSSELAAASGTQPDALYRLLRALASQGIFAEDQQGRFDLTPLAQSLRQGVPGSLHSTVLFHGDPITQGVWGELLHAVKTGEDGYHRLYGMSAWSHREQHLDYGMLFDNFMTEVTMLDVAAVVAAYDFSSITLLVDIAGGHGSLIAAILKANPTLQGILFDQPHVISGAQPVLESAGVTDRCQQVSGDFFAELPTNGDAYLLKSIIHDWNDADSIRILKNVRRAIQPDGKLLLVDFVIPPGNDPHPGKLPDINMLVSLGGRERTEAEFRDVLAQAGFRLTQVIPTSAGKSVIEAVPV
jgi:ubiquinone/menaquinone biosynthesis C-methylase UbiE